MKHTSPPIKNFGLKNHLNLIKLLGYKKYRGYGNLLKPQGGNQPNTVHGKFYRINDSLLSTDVLKKIGGKCVLDEKRLKETYHQRLCGPCLYPDLNKPIVKRHSETIRESGHKLLAII